MKIGGEEFSIEDADAAMLLGGLILMFVGSWGLWGFSGGMLVIGSVFVAWALFKAVWNKSHPKV